LVTSIVFAAAALLVGGEPSAIAQAVTEQQGRLKATLAQREVCYTLATDAAHLDLADCLSFADAPEPLFRAEVCNFLSETGQLEDFKLTSHSECVRNGF
jgi:hypothetical protein